MKILYEGYQVQFDRDLLPTSYQEKNNLILPEEIQIIAIDIDQTTNIDIQFKNIEFNRTLNFPYRIPKGFEEIVLK